jgi:hypothetical protein
MKIETNKRTSGTLLGWLAALLIHDNDVKGNHPRRAVFLEQQSHREPYPSYLVVPPFLSSLPVLNPCALLWQNSRSRDITYGQPCDHRC